MEPVSQLKHSQMATQETYENILNIHRMFSFFHLTVHSKKYFPL